MKSERMQWKMIETVAPVWLIGLPVHELLDFGKQGLVLISAEHISILLFSVVAAEKICML